MFFPYRTDAAEEGRFTGTLALVAVNVAVAVFLGFGGTSAPAGELVLRWGRFNPVTWLTSAFVHYNGVHLFFNVLFLWSFGLIVEGRAGWAKLLALYGAIALAEGCVDQLLMLGSHGQAAGASGVITGFVAISLLWAPRNKVSVFTWFMSFAIRPGTVEIRVSTLCWILIAFDVLDWLFSGFAVGTGLLHLIGGAAGFGAGLWMLKEGHVDCGGWDYLSLKKHGRPPRGGEEVAAAAPGPPPTPGVAALLEIREALDAGRPLDAYGVHARARRQVPAWRLPPEDHERLALALADAGQAEAGVPCMEEVLAAGAKEQVRLAYARLLLAARRPTQALAQLAALDEAALTEAQRAEKERVEAEARAKRAGPGLELE